jgi:dipeptidyl aminopeptidase/acylaminoacyl peptidase
VADGRGQARLATRTRAEREEWWSRENSQSEWQLIAETDLPLIEDPFRPVGYGQNPNDLFHLAWDSNTWSLYAMDLANGFEDRLAFTHTVIDVKSVDRLGVTDRVVAAAYLDGRPQRFYVDARVGVVNAMLSNALPEHNIEIVNESWDQNTYIALARPPGRSGDYYRVDTVSGVIERLGPQYPALADVDLASTETLRIVDPEGGQFGAHLTLPRDASGPVPVVVLPRSAVSDADLEDPQTLVQFIAASGFAVLRVDQRGSHEYGQSWTEIKNYIGWERQADDMVLAVTQLAESGAIDGSRVCMIGRDLGGQISLMTAVRHPDFLRCLITIRLQIGGTSRPADFTSKELFDARPRERVREINPPVLLIDEHRAQVTEDADDQLRRADKDVRWIEYEYATPQFRRAHNRTDMLVRIGAFLNEHLQ